MTKVVNYSVNHSHKKVALHGGSRTNVVLVLPTVATPFCEGVPVKHHMQSLYRDSTLNIVFA